MKKRQNHQNQVVFGFSGSLQQDLELYQGVMGVAQAAGWHVLGVHEQFERSLTRLVDAGAVQGVIGEFMSEAWLGDLPERIPLVHVGRSVFSERIAAVTFDWRAIGRAAGAHFEEMGYRRVRIYEIPGQPLPAEVFAGLADFGEASRLRVRGGGELAALLREPGREPVGILCPSDFVARQVIQVAEREGFAVPEVFGVLGIGDRFMDRIAVERGISSIPLPHEALGRAAGELLQQVMRGDRPRQLRVPPGGVVARETTLRDSHPRALVVRVEGIFRQNLADPPDLEAVSRQVGMSRRAFERGFRVQAGTSPYQYLLRLRLEAAESLLRETDWTVARVGERVGYPDPPRFSAFFRRMTGSSPREWRK